MKAFAIQSPAYWGTLRGSQGKCLCKRLKVTVQSVGNGTLCCEKENKKTSIFPLKQGMKAAWHNQTNTQ